MSDLLEDLLIQASEATKEPPPPSAGGIPRQWVPFVDQTAHKMGFLAPFVAGGLYHMHRFARKTDSPSFQTGEGGCKKRGNCCHYVLIRYSPSRLSAAYSIFWYTQFLGFYPRLKEPQEYEGKEDACDGMSLSQKRWLLQLNIILRPLVCRQWPMIEYFGYPQHTQRGVATDQTLYTRLKPQTTLKVGTPVSKSFNPKVPAIHTIHLEVR